MTPRIRLNGRFISPKGIAALATSQVAVTPGQELPSALHLTVGQTPLQAVKALPEDASHKTVWNTIWWAKHTHLDLALKGIAQMRTPEPAGVGAVLIGIAYRQAQMIVEKRLHSQESWGALLNALKQEARGLCSRSPREIRVGRYIFKALKGVKAIDAKDCPMVQSLKASVKALKKNFKAAEFLRDMTFEDYYNFVCSVSTKGYATPTLKDLK